MAYTAYELVAQDAIADVANLCRHAARANGEFAPETVPSLQAVERWLTLSHAWIAGLLKRHGYSDVQTDATVVGILEELNVYDVCMKVEMSMPSESSSGDPNERFKVFQDRRTELLEQITDGTLGTLGAAGYDSGTRKPIVTGVSYSRKRVAEDDTDRTQHRVRRSQFNNPAAGQEAVLTTTNDWSPS